MTIVDNDRELFMLHTILYMINQYTIAVTVSFSQSTYSVSEDDGSVQPVLVLSNPSSTDITVQVRDNSNTATGE